MCGVLDKEIKLQPKYEFLSLVFYWPAPRTLIQCWCDTRQQETSNSRTEVVWKTAQAKTHSTLNSGVEGVVLQRLQFNFLVVTNMVTCKIKASYRCKAIADPCVQVSIRVGLRFLSLLSCLVLSCLSQVKWSKWSLSKQEQPVGNPSLKPRWLPWRQTAISKFPLVCTVRFKIPIGYHSVFQNSHWFSQCPISAPSVPQQCPISAPWQCPDKLFM